jgi:hypothetical protein
MRAPGPAAISIKVGPGVWAQRPCADRPRRWAWASMLISSPPGVPEIDAAFGRGGWRGSVVVVVVSVVVVFFLFVYLFRWTFLRWLPLVSASAADRSADSAVHGIESRARYAFPPFSFSRAASYGNVPVSFSPARRRH